MKASTNIVYFGELGITSETLDTHKGLLHLPYVNSVLVAVSSDEESQRKATDKFREISSKNKTGVASCVSLTNPSGSTIVPGVGCRVPVFSYFSGRFEDNYSTNGNLVTNNRLRVLMEEMNALVTKSRPKTPYMSWLCKALGTTRPRTLKDLQDLIVEASHHEGSDAIPAISELAVGRGTRHAVMTVRADVQYRDTEPTVNENDWIFADLERLVLGGITDTQAAVLRKTSQAYDKAVRSHISTVIQPKAVEPSAQTEMLEILSA